MIQALLLNGIIAVVAFLLAFFLLKRWLSKSPPRLETLIAISISANLALHLFIIGLLVQALLLLR